MEKRPKVFYGYWVLATAFISLVISTGSVYWAFSLFIKPLQEGLGWSRGQIIIAFTIYSLVGGAAGPFIGRIIDRYGAKKVILFGTIVTGLALASMSLMTSIWHLYISYAVAGVGGSALGHIAQSAIVSRWFARKRGLAIGLMSTGVGIGDVAISPLVGAYLLPHLGWRLSFLSLSVLTLGILLPLIIFVVKSQPADKGLYPDGARTAEQIPVTAKRQPQVSRGLTLGMALATTTFWLIAISFVTNAFSQSSILQSEVVYLTDTGFAVALVATMHGLVGAGSAVGKLCFGWLCDHIAVKYAAVIGHGFLIASILVLLTLKPSSPPFMIWVYTGLLGLGLGSWLPTMSMLTATNFGLVSYAAILGTIGFAQSIGSAVGPLVTNLIHDAAGGYRPAFLVALAMFAVAVPAMLLVRLPRVSGKSGESNPVKHEPTPDGTGQ